MCPETSLYLLDQLREVLGDNSEGSAAHSEVIALFLLVIYPLLQVDLHSLWDRGRVSRQSDKRPF